LIAVLSTAAVTRFPGGCRFLTDEPTVFLAAIKEIPYSNKK